MSDQRSPLVSDPDRLLAPHRHIVPAHAGHQHAQDELFHVDCALAAEFGDRYLHVLAVTAHPDGPWARAARDLVIDLGERADRLLIPQPAGQLAAFDAVLALPQESR